MITVIIKGRMGEGKSLVGDMLTRVLAESGRYVVRTFGEDTMYVADPAVGTTQPEVAAVVHIIEEQGGTP